MIRLSLKSILFLLLATVLFANNLQERFNAGNQFYQQGQYEQAVAEYQAILDAGQESGALYFNLGNACYKLEQFGLARLYYERASVLLKNDEALTDNLELLKQSLVDKIPSSPQFILFEWRDKVLEFFSARLLTWVTAIIFLGFLIVSALQRHSQRRGNFNRFRTTFVMVVVLFLVTIFIFGQKIYLLETEEFGVILAPSVTTLAEPKLSATEVFVIHEGAKVSIERNAAEWLEIKLADGKTGWLQKRNLEKI